MFIIKLACDSHIKFFEITSIFEKKEQNQTNHEVAWLQEMLSLVNVMASVDHILVSDDGQG